MTHRYETKNKFAWNRWIKNNKIPKIAFKIQIL
jgi:hypothetical protein